MSKVAPCEQANERCFLYRYSPPDQLADTQDHGCYKDRDHIVPRRMVIDEPEGPADRLHNDYVLLSPDNIRMICRREHHERNIAEQRYDTLLLPVPPLGLMMQSLRRNIAEGRINTTTNRVSQEQRTPDDILRDIADVERISEDELIQRAAQHVFAGRRSA